MCKFPNMLFIISQYSYFIYLFNFLSYFCPISLSLVLGKELDASMIYLKTLEEPTGIYIHIMSLYISICCHYICIYM